MYKKKKKHSLFKQRDEKKRFYVTKSGNAILYWMRKSLKIIMKKINSLRKKKVNERREPPFIIFDILGAKIAHLSAEI